MEQVVRVSIGRKILGHFEKTLIAGLLILVPVVATYLILRLVFNFLDGILQPGVEALWGTRLPGVGLGILIILIYLSGLVGITFLGKQLIKVGQGMLLRIPLIGVVYSASRQLIESFSGRGTTGFKRVVAIEYPRPSTWTIGFLTGMITDENGKSLGIVYIPTAPTPNSGWVAILSAQDIYDTDLSVPAAMRLVLSGGILAPPQIRKRLLVP
ncbi:MAG: DUF502 domain-containing protein [Chloroflexi bacterium]|nr:DUF502 domain-containing protein [Chloroflexota bacterium]